MNKLYNEFLRLCGILNRKLETTPLLYGSLGLGKLLGIDFNPQDVDLLISEQFLNDKWKDLKTVMEDNGYILEDLREHQFFNGECRVAFADLNVLRRDLDIDLGLLELKVDSDVTYKFLGINDYLKAYEFSSKDGYRRDKNSNKDIYKIQCIREAILESHR